MQLLTKLILIFGFVSWVRAFPDQNEHPSTDGKNSIIQHAANLIDRDGKTGLHLAAEKGLLENAQLYLRNGALTNVTDKFGKTPLHYAAEKGHTEIAALLIENGADVNAKDNVHHSTPLISASIYRAYPAMAELLIKKGADINATISKHLIDGLTLLHLLADSNNDNNGKQEIVDLLIAHGANVNAKDSLGRTPLIVAVHARQLEMGEKLIKNGADVNLVNDGKYQPRRVESNLCKGCTALHWAVTWGNVRFVELLIKNGADLNIRNADRLTPLELADQKASWFQTNDDYELFDNNFAKIAEALKNAAEKTASTSK